jgi:Xaa-Pro aminopeptidase
VLAPHLASACAARRARLLHLLGSQPALIPAGRALPRNYAANTHGFRASSHFLYLVGAALEGAALFCDGEQCVLLVPERAADDELWHGKVASDAELAQTLGITVRPLGELAILRKNRLLATVPPVNAELALEVAHALGRPAQTLGRERLDEPLLDALIQLRLCHDEAALHELRRAGHASVRAHLAGMAATRPGRQEREVCAEMEAVFAREGFGTAYGSIVTVHGEVLHNHHHHLRMSQGDLLLADVGAESDTGYAADITRTWPVGGRFSETQRAAYEVVLASQRAAIERVRPGVRYRDVHLAACRALCEGLVALKILRGNVDSLLEQGAHALFFPHGIGHLLGLDVHDMEDLGDRAGYAAGRTRAAQFGLSYLRLDRDLTAGMLVTIEPGFYQVPSLLAEPARVGLSGDALNRTELARFSDVRGIRIEDDVLVTAQGCEVLTAALPKTVSELEALVPAY